MDLTAGANRRTSLAAAVLAAALLAVPMAATSGAQPLSAQGAGDSARYLVRVSPGSLDSLGGQVAQLGGTVERKLHGLAAAVVTLPVKAAETLRDGTGVLGVTPDAPLKLQGEEYDPKSEAGSSFNVSQVTGARRLWNGGTTGRGVDVALIDSGVTRVEGLQTANKVVDGPDLSFDSQDPKTRYLDGFGHGTFMAGLIAGTDGSYASSAYNGMAPGARVISLKVADSRGNTDVTQVMAAIDWVVQHRKDPGMNIRVLNLSFGTPSMQSYVLDPLAYAAEVAWRKGIVVVVSAGNDGTGTGKLLNPAQDPYVLAVGAEDSRGTSFISDDTIPAFSTRGDGIRNPDVVAPGRSIQGLRVPGSYADVNYGATAAFQDRFFRGSGTSQAAAVVSGAAALLLQQRPGLTPDQVKGLLTGTARTLPAANAQAQGSGLIDVYAATQAPAPLRLQTHVQSTGTGTLDGARGEAKLALDGVTLSGDKDIFGNPYNTSTRALQEATETSWDGGTWNGATWAGSSWAGSSWAGATWAGSSWAGSSWAGATWAGSSWAGSSWAGSSWATGDWR